MKFSFSSFGLVFLSAIVLVNCNNETPGVAATKTHPHSALGPDAATSLPAVFEKLVGTWQSENGKNFERWNKNGDGTYRSDVYSLEGTDTTWNEHAHIYPENDQWVFENTVKGQNGGKPVKFTSTFLTGNSVQFSNPAHDFPTDVNYTITDQNLLNAFIIGPNSKGGRDTIPFNSRRVF